MPLLNSYCQVALLCLATETQIHVCNPSTNQPFELPVCGSKIVGFGTGKLDSRVQLVLLLRYLQHTQKTEQSARLGSRTFMEDFHHPVEMFSPPAFANETTYWKIDRSSNHYSSCILKTCCLFWLDTACSKFNSSIWEFVHGRDLRLSHVAVWELRIPWIAYGKAKKKKHDPHKGKFFYWSSHLLCSDEENI
jgi:hypothetical protein